MIDLQANFGLRRRPRLFALPVVAVLCVVLLMLLTVVQVAHVHPINGDPDHCQLCIAMQTAAPVAVLTAVVVLVMIAAAAPLVEAQMVVRHWHPKLYSRPPPVGC